jgi:hypothetical protein
MKPKVDTVETAPADLSSPPAFTGDLSIQLGASWVNANCPATEYDIDAVTLDAK